MRLYPFVFRTATLHIERLCVRSMQIGIAKCKRQTNIEDIDVEVSIEVPSEWISSRRKSLRIVKNGIEIHSTADGDHVFLSYFFEILGNNFVCEKKEKSHRGTEAQRKELRLCAFVVKNGF